MSSHHQQSKARHDDPTELDDDQLEHVSGGAAFLAGSLTAQEDAAASVDTGGRADGFIMKDTIIIRTGR